jgi:hypothetical protein
LPRQAQDKHSQEARKKEKSRLCFRTTALHRLCVGQVLI